MKRDGFLCRCNGQGKVQILLFGGVFALSILLSPALNKPKNEQSIQMEIIKGNQTDSEELKTDGGE